MVIGVMLNCMVELLKFATESISNYFATLAMIFVISVGLTAVLSALIEKLHNAILSIIIACRTTKIDEK